MGKKRQTTWPVDYAPVEHETDAARKAKYSGCVSRQHLRKTMRSDAAQDIAIEFKVSPFNSYCGVSRRFRRELSSARMKHGYRTLMGWPTN